MSDEGAPRVLDFGHRLMVEEEGARVVVRAPDGGAVVDVRLTADGPVVRVQATELEVAGTERLALRGKHVDIEADQLEMRVRGNLVEHVGGDVHRRAEGMQSLGGADVSLCAGRGEVRIEAHDDVEVKGERVRLNCDDPPMPVSWEEHDRRRRARVLSSGDGVDVGGDA